jgi:methyl acetate hydrolase
MSDDVYRRRLCVLARMKRDAERCLAGRGRGSSGERCGPTQKSGTKEAADMSQDLTRIEDAILEKVVSSSPRVPGVVAMVTDREGTIYEGAAGKRVIGEDANMTTDSVFAIFSTTKAITSTVVLQLVEEGKLDLDAPAKTYAPEIGKLEVLEGFDAAGQPLLRAPKRDITTRMLLLHTAGFGYDFFNENYKRLTQELGVPGVVSSTKACISTPLLFDPGDRWEYGTSVDWAGQVVEGITGRRLDRVLAERILEPLGMADTAFKMTPSMRERLAPIHQRGADGSLTPLIGFELPQDPEVHMGGGGLYSTVGDYCRFIRMWLNDGMAEGARILKPETVRMAEKNGLGDLKIKMLPGVLPALSNDAEFFPGLSKSWSLGFMVNDEAAPTGRPAGALSWAGLANCFFWIDRQNGIGGYWATQILPFIDPVSYPGFVEFETAVYESIQLPVKVAVPV